MNHETAVRILEVQEKFRNAPEFESLWAEHPFLAEQFEQAMARIPEAEAEAIDDFFGIVNEIHLRTLAYAVSSRG